MAENKKRSPVTINELIQLENLGIPQEQVTWSRVTMVSDQWIAVRHDNGEKHATVTVLNPREGTKLFAGTTSADSLLMNPSHPIIALKASLRFEVFNFGAKMLVSKMDMVDRVIYWTWVNSDIIAIVTDNAVFHWDLWQGDSPPECVFNRHNRLAFSEIVSYKADRSLKWLAVTGLTPEEDRISGVTQLYNVDEDITQCINSHAVCFTHYRFDDNPLSSTVFCVASRDLQDKGKIHVIELGPYKHGNFAPRNSYTEIRFSDDLDRYDFPVSLQVSGEYGLLYVLTKYGYLYLCDMETAACLCVTRVSPEIIFTSTLNSATQGILGITRSGRILSVDIKRDVLLSQVRESAKWANQASRLERAIARSDEKRTPSKQLHNNNYFSALLNNNNTTTTALMGVGLGQSPKVSGCAIKDSVDAITTATSTSSSSSNSSSSSCVISEEKT